MCSRLNASILSLALISLLATGCNLETGDWVAPKDRGRLVNNCISNLNDEVREFINGDRSQKGIAQTMACVRRTLDEFNYYGNDENGGFKASDLAGFLNNKFLGESKITDELLDEFMEIKIVVVGGRRDFVTNGEFGRLIQLTHTFEKLALKTGPYMKLYRGLLSESERKKVSLKKLEDAKESLRWVAVVLGEVLMSSSGNYKVDSFQRLVKHSRIFLEWEETEDSHSAEELSEIFEVYKLFSVGSRLSGKNEVIAPGQWIPFLDIVSQVFGLYLDYLYKFKPDEGKEFKLTNLTEGKTLTDFIYTALGDRGFFQILISAINNQPELVIKFDLLNRVIGLIYDSGVIPENINLRLEDSLIPFVEYTVKKVLRDLAIPLADADTDGLRVSHVTEMKKEFSVWAGGQLYIDHYFNNGDQVILDLSNENLKNMDHGKKEVFEHFIQNLEPIYTQGDKRAWIFNTGLEDEFDVELARDFPGMSRLNVIKMFARFLIRGFAEDKNRAKDMVGITENEAAHFSEVARNIGQDLEFMDKRNANVGGRFFTEANLFTLSADGIAYSRDGSVEGIMTFQEAIEQLMLIYSGLSIRDNIYNESAKKFVRHRIEKDVNGKEKVVYDENSPRDVNFLKPLLPREKFLKQLASESYKHFSNLPALVSYLEKSELNGRAHFFANMLEISHHPCAPLDKVEFGELAMLSTLIHYIEVLFKRYDINLDNVLDGHEVMSSYSKFRGFLIPMIKAMTSVEEVSESRAKAVFAFLLMKGRVPDKTSYGDRAIIGAWQVDHFNNDIEQFNNRCEAKWYKIDHCSAPEMFISRTDILRVLGLIIESTQVPNCGKGPKEIYLSKDAG